MEEKKKKFSGYFKVSSSKYARDLIFFFHKICRNQLKW